MLVRTARVAALVCLVAGCQSSPARDEAGPMASSSPGPAASVRNLAAGGWTSNKACLLLDRAEVVAALGEAGLQTTQTPVDGEQKDSPVVDCTYNLGGKPGFARVTIDIPSRAQDFGTIYPPPNVASTKVPGIGDAAFQSENAGMGFILYVKKGDVTFWVQAQTADKGEKDKALVRTLAKKAAERL